MEVKNQTVAAVAQNVMQVANQAEASWWVSVLFSALVIYAMYKQFFHSTPTVQQSQLPVEVHVHLHADPRLFAQQQQSWPSIEAGDDDDSSYAPSQASDTSDDDSDLDDASDLDLDDASDSDQDAAHQVMHASIVNRP